MFAIVSNFSFFFTGLLMFCLFPLTMALPNEAPFPDISFQAFSHFITDNFHSNITLASVLCILFSLTENPDLLNLHSRQQNARFKGEKSVAVTGWMRCLARTLQAKLSEGEEVLKDSDSGPDMSDDVQTTNLVVKLDAFAKLLRFNPCNSDGKVKRKLKPISYRRIEGVRLLCPDPYQCVTASCKALALQQSTKPRDIPLVTLIKGFQIYEGVPVLTGKCTKCMTTYHADHERSPSADDQTRFTRVYLNSAKYLKVGQNVWVDRLFSNGVINGMYSFHASASAYTEFWNNTIWAPHSGQAPKITRRQIWQAFVQESIRAVASHCDFDLQMDDGLPIHLVTKQAFAMLGERGMIRSAEGHECSECTHEYKERSDQLGFYDEDAMVGMDEHTGPVLPQERRQREREVETDEDMMEIPQGTLQPPSEVRMVVLDGIVMGPIVSLYISLHRRIYIY